MNKASKLVSGSFIKKDFRTFFLNKKSYTVHPPTLKVICRILYEWSYMGFNPKNQTPLSVLSQIPQNRKYVIRGLCMAIVGDSFFWRIKYWYLSKKIDCTSKELSDAVTDILDLMGAEDFFQAASSIGSATNLIAKSK